ncbi:ABC transporter permease [Rhizobium ruizarguesonis]|jgi:putative spermidine/putrescine transport system permease protein/spermidine/putrescine transport system permease protein|uniref:ABC transporter permease n=1 Tax=Rhizobium ruizarguesonis TaxID=2081791 RepID=A0AAE8TY30_9HYPH|nr:MULTISPECIES: ABC transporter permease [Rhizobium]NEH87413.1 ABC transporter permease subunit [Rhizobium ruizarguesonis]NEI16391.1 ABC transporter permease subunit [Rhizobium ruizarguesonis]NEJ08612.1 ABC transporter permease subunit [Rhizobium ruizarguesonis]NEJ17020.1 ABC transporter permease subunit [Rhizobium ruizarguesonis]NEJ59448.1 ABC transporter permease subunit [Rhizobium ruizarguesonis]
MSLPERITVTLLWIIGTITFAVLYAPAAIVILLSFVGVKDRKLDWSDLSLQWYGKFASNSQLIDALSNSLIVGVCAVVIASTISVGLAYYMKTGARAGRSYVEFVIFLPFVLPAIITGISLLIAFRQVGIERSLITVTAGHVVLILAVIYRMVTIRLDALENSQIEASLDLGANSWETFVHVVFPQLRSALLTSSLLAFALSFDETLVTFFLVGGETTLPMRLWAMMRTGFTPEINALVSVVLCVTLLFAALAAMSLRESIERKS